MNAGFARETGLFNTLSVVMPGFMPGIHVFLNLSFNEFKTWMAGTSPAMTIEMRCHAFCVMPGFIQGIHVFLNLCFNELKTWMAGPSPAMTDESLSTVKFLRMGLSTVMPRLYAGHPRLYGCAIQQEWMAEQRAFSSERMMQVSIAPAPITKTAEACHLFASSFAANLRFSLLSYSLS